MSSASGCSRLTSRDWLKFLANLAIPLAIGAFTIVISMHQQNVVQTTYNKDAAQRAELHRTEMERRIKQREEDREIARLQREEDRNISRLQREEDRKLLDRQREEDQDAACRQLAEDREAARLQRELDLQIAIDKRRQENELAELQRSLYQSRRAHEMALAQEKYVSEVMLEEGRQHDELLVQYQRELTVLLGQLPTHVGKFDQKFVSVIQMQTKATLELLDTTHRTILLKNLLQANFPRHQWKGKSSVLYQANVSGVQFNHLIDHRTTDFPDLEQADVRYASFRSVVFPSLPSFAYSNLDYTDWSFSEINSTNFGLHMTMNNAIFTGSRWMQVSWERTPLNQVSFQHNAYCVGCMLLETPLVGARFDHSTFSMSSFATLSMPDANLSNASIVDSDFNAVILDRFDANGADLRRCTFYKVSMVNCSMFNVQLEGARFTHVDMSGCVGFPTEQLQPRPTFVNVTLPNGTLVLS